MARVGLDSHCSRPALAESTAGDVPLGIRHQRLWFSGRHQRILTTPAKVSRAGKGKKDTSSNVHHQRVVRSWIAFCMGGQTARPADARWHSAILLLLIVKIGLECIHDLLLEAVSRYTSR